VEDRETTSPKDPPPEEEPGEARETAPAPGPAKGSADGSPGQRIALRFVLVYLFVFLFPFPIGSAPGTSWLGQKYEAAWGAVTPWIGKHVLRLGREVATEQTDSGDTTAYYIQLVCFLALAALGAAAWSALSRRWPSRERAAHAWLRVYVRYALASILMVYAAVKIIKSQFPFPSPDRLLAPFGQTSPMGLLWRFMGYSTAYTLFAGLTEALGAGLVLFRRTTTLGALVLTGVMANVVMLNFCYDVPVKIYSTHLLLMAVFLMSPDLRRLADVLVLNRPSAPSEDPAPPLLLRFPRIRLAVKSAAICVMVGATFFNAWSNYTKWGDGAPRHALYGAYEVESFERNGAVVPPLLTDDARWRHVAVNGAIWTATLMNDSKRGYYMSHDAAASKLTLTDDQEKEYTVSLTLPDPERLLLEGTVGPDRLAVRLRRIDPSRYLLVRSGFRWIQEEPYNR
jgi:hypothetical protein